MDLRDQLQVDLAGRYTIERELGGGGMARVFVALETALGRRVVIKVVSPDLALGLSVRRFEREIRLAASLQQANIVPVLAAGESGGLPLYTMPFVEGRSLRERLRDRVPLPFEQTVGILRDVARALAYAHERGVVHRDIKPENVLLSGDAAVVTDFGIAKALSAAREGDTGERTAATTLTDAGLAIGTPGYMPPEQITGDPGIDHRADLYSFGCMAYELLTGQPPFDQRPVQAIVGAHLAEAPVPVAERNPGCPPALARVVMQCLEKDPARRPESARPILQVLDGVTAPATGISRLIQGMTRRQRTGVMVLAGLVVVSAIAWRASGRPATAGPAVLASVAVVPFLNVSGDSAEAYLADGMADGLATALGKVAGIHVVPRSASYRYRGRQDVDALEIGRTLSATHVLQGTLRPAGGRLLLSAQLTSVRENREVWSENYDRPAGDAFRMHDEMVGTIARALRGSLGGPADAVPASARSGTASPEAYDLYLRGRFLLQRRGPGVRQAADLFQEAVTRDSMFAAAHASLALALELLPYFEAISARAVHDRVIAASRRALALDSTQAEAHVALAMAHQHAYEWSEAEADYRRAVALAPDELDVRIQYGRFLYYTGQFDRAMRQFERAREVDPYSAVASGWVGGLLGRSGRALEGLREIQRALQIDSTNPPTLAFATDAYLQAGQPDSSRAYADRIWRTIPAWRISAAAAFAALGDPEPAWSLLRGIEAESTPEPLRHTRLAILSLALDDTSRTLAELERATAAGEIWPTYYSLSERRFDPLRRSARFAAIVRSIGLDERTFTSPTGGRPR